MPKSVILLIRILLFSIWLLLRMQPYSRVQLSKNYFKIISWILIMYINTNKYLNKYQNLSKIYLITYPQEATRQLSNIFRWIRVQFHNPMLSSAWKAWSWRPRSLQRGWCSFKGQQPPLGWPWQEKDGENQIGWAVRMGN